MQRTAADFPDVGPIRQILLQGGPRESDFPELNRYFQNTYTKLDKSSVQGFSRHLAEIFERDHLKHTVQGFAYRKPHGYAGDFEIIDKVYSRLVHTDPLYGRWDDFFHFNPAVQAVRNRLAYFSRLLLEKKSRTSLRVLNLASGPGRDIYEHFSMNGQENVIIDCVDLDASAIEFSRKLNSEYVNKLKFIHQNVLWFKPVEKYDLIWSAGLFDYFRDSIFVRLLKKMKRWLKREGELVIGNSNTANPTRGYMEIALDWYLIHRSPENLMNLATEAGFSIAQTTIDQEPLGINLFLRIKN